MSARRRHRGPARAWRLAILFAVALGAGCREVIYDILTDERTVRVPVSSRSQVTIDTGRIDLPTRLGTDKT